VGAPIRGRCPVSEVNDGGLSKKTDHLNNRYPLAQKQEAPSQPIPMGRFLMQQPPALAAFLKEHRET